MAWGAAEEGRGCFSHRRCLSGRRTGTCWPCRCSGLHSGTGCLGTPGSGRCRWRPCSPGRTRTCSWQCHPCRCHGGRAWGCSRRCSPHRAAPCNLPNRPTQATITFPAETLSSKAKAAFNNVKTWTENSKGELSSEQQILCCIILPAILLVHNSMSCC